MADFTGQELRDLNNFMRDFPSGTIVPEQYVWKSLYDGLKSRVKKGEHVGDNLEILIETSSTLTGTAMGENADIVKPGLSSYDKMLVPLAEVQANIGLTRQAMRRASGMPGSWGNIVKMKQDQLLKVDFPWLMEICALGDGSGRLARVSAVTATTATLLTITCDNTYTDFGIENVQMLRKGMRVNIAAADGTIRDLGAVTDGIAQITGVTPGYRTAGGSYAATTGTFTIATTGSSTCAIADGDIVYLAGTIGAPITASGDATDLVPDMTEYEAGHTDRFTLPVGLLGIVQDGGAAHYVDSATDYKLTTFQNVTRATYPTLNSTIWQATDFGGTTDGTPDEWDLSTITDLLTNIENETGKQVDVFFASPQLAQCMHRLMRTETGLNVSVGNTGGVDQNVVGSMIPRFFDAGDRMIPIVVSRSIPRHVLYGITSEDLEWRMLGDFDYMRLNGDVWMKSPADRKTNFEAPYGGFFNVAAKRCDSMFCLQDLRHDL